MPSHPLAKTVALTVVTLLAFAGNSILGRLALHAEAIDPLSYTAIRLSSGALALLPFLRRGPRPWNPKAALVLIAYAVAFSLAYVTLDTGTGALLLFGTVQFTMIGSGLRQGERPSLLRLLGIAIAVTGVVVLCLPGVSAPDARGAILMIAAGFAWGVYSLIGRGTTAPSAATACNFLMAAPLALLVLWLAESSATLTLPGVLFAIASGATTSGLGYILWYTTLPGHSATSAAVVQLAVPVIASVGGVVFLGEELTSRLLGAGALTLGGIAVAALARGGRHLVR